MAPLQTDATPIRTALRGMRSRLHCVVCVVWFAKEDTD